MQKQNGAEIWKCSCMKPSVPTDIDARSVVPLTTGNYDGIELQS